MELSRSGVISSGFKQIDPLPATNSAQAGPNCGLYALSYVMRHWHAKLDGTGKGIAEPLPARKLDVEGTVKLPKGDPNKKVSLREIAKGLSKSDPSRFSYIGELFSATAMAEVARHSGFDAKVHNLTPQTYLKTLYELIDKGRPVLVAFDVDQDLRAAGKLTVKGPNNGLPGQFGGEHAHWAVAVAYKKGWFTDELIIFHWEKYFRFPSNQLKDSANQCLRFSGQTWQKPKDPAERKTAVGKPTLRGAHWQKVQASVQPRNLSTKGVSSGMGTTTTKPGTYAELLDQPTIMKTVFKNVDLDLRNQFVEVALPDLL